MINTHAWLHGQIEKIERAMEQIEDLTPTDDNARLHARYQDNLDATETAHKAIHAADEARIKRAQEDWLIAHP